MNALHAANLRFKPVTLSLVVASGICLILTLLSCGMTQSSAGTYMVKNLLLAWIPYLLALGMGGLKESRLGKRWLLAGVFVLWVLFFPNANYMVTDLIHIKSRPNVPKWFDHVYFTAYAFVGLVLGYLALRLIQKKIALVRGRMVSWGFVLVMLGAGSLGVYVGQFLRWNSWDILVRPWRPLAQLSKFGQLETMMHVLTFCGTFFLLSVLVYVVLEGISPGWQD